MKLKLLVFLLLNAAVVVFAQEAQENVTQNSTANNITLKIDVPLFDLPYQIDIMRAMDYAFPYTYTSPSMQQSLALTMGVYSSMHFGLKKMYDSLPFSPLLKDVIYATGTAAGIFGFVYVFPFGYPWMKDRYQHLIFSRNGIDSYSNTGGYYMGVTDANLAKLKNDSPYDFIRMNVAGMEAYNIFSDRLMRNSFFYDLENLSFVSALVPVLINQIDFIDIIANEMGLTDSEDEIDERYETEEGIDQKERFIALFEPTNWVYELFRPNEPYADRGLHPSGDGSVARYIKVSQLSEDERKYLLIHAGLHNLNFVSPLLYGLRSFALGESGLEGNIALRHYLTSFGADIPVSVFLRYNSFNIAFTYHNYMNYRNYFAAIEAELVDYPLAIGAFKMLLSPRFMIGAQPVDQEFKTDSPEFFGLLGVRVDFNLSKHVLPYFNFSAKTDGWLAGNEYLTGNVSMQAGISLRF